MIVILHMDDDRTYWVNNVHEQRSYLADVIGEPVEVLRRASIPRARGVVEGSDEETNRLAGQGHRLNAVILDLLMGGGREKDVRNWLEGVGKLAESFRAPEGAALPADVLAEIDRKCPAPSVGRLAAAKGAKVIILTNVAKFLKPERLDAQTEYKLLMAACGASAYITKADDQWLKKLGDALADLRTGEGA